MHKTFLSLFIIAFSQFSLKGQTTSVLFIGNSYVYVNDLPHTFASLSLSLGDSVFVDSNAPGGYTLNMHSTNAVTISKINQQPWDYVVLQEQSQMPSFPPVQVASDTYPYATRLDSMIRANDSCTETVFYMTWGRKNGDASNCAAYPPVCTYEGMQQRLRESYLQMAQDNHATCSPCGIAWKHIRDNYPAINLYQADESHPTVEGTYLNACVFYATLFHKTPIGASYTSGLTPAEALILQTIGGATVLDSISLWQNSGDIPYSEFSFIPSGFTLQMVNNSINATSYLWNFGDGSTDTVFNPSHTYSTSGNFIISLLVSDSCRSSVIRDTVFVSATTGIDNYSENEISIYPNPSSSEFQISNCAFQIQTIKIFNVIGEEVNSQWSMVNRQCSFDLSGLTNGMYYLEVKTDSGTFRKKLIKQ